MMQGIKNIIFDLGGVILDIDIKLTEEAFANLGIKDFSQYFGHGFADSIFKDYEIGKITDAQFIDYIRKLGDHSLPDSIIIKAWNALLLDFPPERIDLLQRIRKHYRIFLFSNTNALHAKVFHKIYRDTFTGGHFDELFEKTYYSHVLGMRKPDLGSFKHIIGVNHLRPEETLFIDDAWINIQGAQKAGLKGFFLEPGKTVTDIDFGLDA
jgi:glucose-1-phosphatase